MPYPYDFKDEDLSPSLALCIRRETRLADLDLALAEVLAEISAYLRELQAEPAGPPFACYHAIGTDTVDLEAGFPVSGELPSRRQIKAVQIDGGQAVSTTVSRSREPVTYADEALRSWLDKQCLAAVGPLIEVYLAGEPQAAGARQGRMKLIQRVEFSPSNDVGSSV